jgi:hypothetical protein
VFKNHKEGIISQAINGVNITLWQNKISKIKT